jgi:hypothetical protein
VDFRDFARVRAGDLDRSFVRLQLEDTLFFLDLVPFADEDVQHVTGFNAITQVG